MSAEDVTRMFMPRKGPQRTASSSSLASTSSTSSAASDSTAVLSDSRAKRENINVGGEKELWVHQKYSRPVWPPGKVEAAAAAVAGGGRPQQGGTSQGTGAVTASPAMSALHAAAPIVPSQKMMQTAQQVNGSRLPAQPMVSEPQALLVLLPMNGTFERKQINVPLYPEILKIGRQTNAKTVPTAHNGYFDSKVLSRQHAEIWADQSRKVWIRDVKSSNGTFVNGVRLSPESRDSEPHELRENDMLELGIDIVSEDQKSIVHHKVSAKVEHAGIPTNATNVLDLSFGDIDPGSGGGLMGPMFPHQVQMRGRGASQGSNMSNGRIVGNNMIGGNMNGMGVQRHMNAWLSPVTIEQVVKRLGVSSSGNLERSLTNMPRRTSLNKRSNNLKIFIAPRISLLLYSRLNLAKNFQNHRSTFFMLNHTQTVLLLHIYRRSTPCHHSLSLLRHLHNNRYRRSQMVHGLFIMTPAVLIH